MTQKFLEAGIAIGLSAMAAGPLALGETASPDPIAGKRMTQPCLSCHTLDSFARFDSAELLAAITAINAGERGHIPLPITLSEQDVANIAAFISEANSAAD